MRSPEDRCIKRNESNNESHESAGTARASTDDSDEDTNGNVISR